MLFRVEGADLRRLQLFEQASSALCVDNASTDVQGVKLLFRSWFYFSYSVCDAIA